jgi:hypothetical protein
MAKINYEEAIKKPFTDIVELILGIVLSSIPIVWWFAKGFILECSGMGKTKPSKKMPDWNNWGYLFIKGLASDIILVIYAIPAILVFAIGAGSFLSYLIQNSLIPQGLMESNSVIPQNLLPELIRLAPILVLSAILFIIAVYLAPIAVLNYIKTKKFREAFNFSKITKRALTGDYFVNWLIVAIMTVIVTLILSVIPWFGQRIAFFITGVIGYSIYGQLLRKE